MVQVVENWSRITGTVRAVAPDPELPDHVVVSVDVDATEPVARESGEPFPHLLAAAPGERLDLTLPAGAAARAGLAAGRRISGRAQRFSPFRCFLDAVDLTVE